MAVTMNPEDGDLAEVMSFLRELEERLIAVEVRITVDTPSEAGLDLESLMRRRRRDLDLKQKHLSKAMDVDQSTISRWERGVVPDADHLHDLAVALDVPLTVVTQAAAVSARIKRERKRRRRSRAVD